MYCWPTVCTADQLYVRLTNCVYHWPTVFTTDQLYLPLTNCMYRWPTVCTTDQLCVPLTNSMYHGPTLWTGWQHYELLAALFCTGWNMLQKILDKSFIMWSLCIKIVNTSIVHKLTPLDINLSSSPIFLAEIFHFRLSWITALGPIFILTVLHCSMQYCSICQFPSVLVCIYTVCNPWSNHGCSVWKNFTIKTLSIQPLNTTVTKWDIFVSKNILGTHYSDT